MISSGPDSWLTASRWAALEDPVRVARGFAIGGLAANL